MHLSTSSSNDRLPKGNWIAIWGGVFIVIAVSALFFEWHIRSLGWSPSVVDSVNLWVDQRRRASELREKALILVGASRMQLDMDMAVLREESGLEPVQLAIDGTTYIPVLEDLAEDSNISGTILVSVNAYNMSRGKPKDTSSQWVNYYKYVSANDVEPYRIIHNRITSLLNNSLVTRLEGAKPYTVISNLAFKKPSAGNYLITHDDRSRDADYKKVAMPNFYAARLQRHFGKSLIKNAPSFEQFFSTYKKEIEGTQAVNRTNFLKNLEYLLALVGKIEAHGGKVVFIRFPTGKLVWEVDTKRYPKTLFWDEVGKQHAASINFSNYSSLNNFVLPDGSHLDYRDKELFTSSLMTILQGKHYL